jgi:uncharacterized protein YbaA (DUF1428 family)
VAGLIHSSRYGDIVVPARRSIAPTGLTNGAEPGGNMHYVDGFVVPVKKAELASYRRLARKMASVCKEYGALEYVECVADDVKPGKLTSFPQAVKLKRDETVVFAYVVYRSRKHRDQVNAKIMKDPRFANMDMSKMPFDPKRMFWGGFKQIVSV